MSVVPVNVPCAIIMYVWLFTLLLGYLKPRLWVLLYKGVERLIGIVATIIIIVICSALFAGAKRVQKDAYHFTVNNVRLWTFNRQMGKALADFSGKAERIMGGDRTALVYPYSPILYTLLNLQDPLKYDILIKLGNDKGTPDSILVDAIRRLKSMPVRFVITYDWAPNVFRAVSRSLGMQYTPNILDNFILGHYTPVISNDGFMLLQMKNPVP